MKYVTHAGCWRYIWAQPSCYLSGMAESIHCMARWVAGQQPTILQGENSWLNGLVLPHFYYGRNLPLDAYPHAPPHFGVDETYHEEIDAEGRVID